MLTSDFIKQRAPKKEKLWHTTISQMYFESLFVYIFWQVLETIRVTSLNCLLFYFILAFLQNNWHDMSIFQNSFCQFPNKIFLLTVKFFTYTEGVYNPLAPDGIPTHSNEYTYVTQNFWWQTKYILTLLDLTHEQLVHGSIEWISLSKMQVYSKSLFFELDNWNFGSNIVLVSFLI